MDQESVSSPSAGHSSGGSDIEVENVPMVDEVQRVEAERMGSGPEYRFGKRAPGVDDLRSGRFESGVSFGISGGSGPGFMKPPIFAAWVCLLLSWLFLGSRIPFTVFLGVPFSLVALLLGAVCLSRGGVITGALVLFFGTVGSFVVYLVGLFRFLARF